METNHDLSSPCSIKSGYESNRKVQHTLVEYSIESSKQSIYSASFQNKVNLEASLAQSEATVVKDLFAIWNLILKLICSCKTKLYY